MYFYLNMQDLDLIDQYHKFCINFENYMLLFLL